MIDSMKRARARMLIKHPFFASLVMTTPMIETDEIPTAATDMKSILYNPEFFKDLDDDETLFVLAHEVMHMALEHGFRRLNRNHMRWNIACDYAINAILVDGGLKCPSMGLLDSKYFGMSADKIYELLPENPEESSNLLGDLQEPGGNPAQQAKAQRAIQQRVAAAASIARMAGKLSGELARIVGEILDPAVPWQDLLRDYMTRITKDDESWSRRNRRFRNVYLPDRHCEKMGEFILIADTSGSIGQKELDQVASEIQAVADQVKPEGIRVIWADTKVAGDDYFAEGEPLVLNPKGGGGTDMRVPLQHVEQYQPQIVVLVTDGYTPWPECDPEYPLIVCCTTNTDVPIGQVVRL